MGLLGVSYLKYIANDMAFVFSKQMPTITGNQQPWPNSFITSFTFKTNQLWSIFHYGLYLFSFCRPPRLRKYLSAHLVNFWPTQNRTIGLKWSGLSLDAYCPYICFVPTKLWQAEQMRGLQMILGSPKQPTGLFASVTESRLREGRKKQWN